MKTLTDKMIYYSFSHLINLIMLFIYFTLVNYNKLVTLYCDKFLIAAREN
jgi:general stress protein CsbA